jgi:phage replication-related protein YjqB (UPF0714/DUF867 family)
LCKGCFRHAKLKRSCEQFDAKPAEIRQLLRGGLNPQRSAELIEKMRAAGLSRISELASGVSRCCVRLS